MGRPLTRTAVAVVAAGAAALTTVAATPAGAEAPGGRPTSTVDGVLATVARPGMSGGWAGWRVEVSVSGHGVVATADAAGNGRFSMTVDEEVPEEGFVSFVAHSPEGPATLVTVAQELPSPTRVTLNERTTVAAAWTMAQFVDQDGIDGEAPGPRNSAGMAANLADPRTGTVAHTLGTAPNGDDTSTERAFTTLTAALAACTVGETGACTELLETAAVAEDPSDPRDAFRALAEVARNPAVADPERLFRLGERVRVPGATLDHAPPAWTLALRFDGDGRSLSGPGNFAIDRDGNLWVNNNYEYARNVKRGMCGSDELFRFGPTGEFTKYSGGGLSGAGYGIVLDPMSSATTADDQVWVSNFGFAAPVPTSPSDQGCAEDDQPPHNSLSLFDAQGRPISPADGYTAGDVSWPQGMAIDQDHTLWVANCQNDTVTRYGDSDPAQASVVSAAELGAQMPFDVVDNGRAVFVSGMLDDSVQVLDYEGNHIGTVGEGTDDRFANPMGLASDAAGNVWAANSTIVLLPCDNTEVEQDYASLIEAIVENGDATRGSVSWISPDGSFEERFFGGGTTLAWGITTDGDGNVWVGNFAGKRISAYCGADAGSCPKGSRETGAPISPAVAGFFFDGLVRTTGVEVDQSGNLWAANNWKEIPYQTNPGGHAITAFLGIAAPKSHP